MKLYIYHNNADVVHHLIVTAWSRVNSVVVLM